MAWNQIDHNGSDHSASLVIHAGGRKVVREELIGLTPMQPNPGYRPIPHYDLLQCITEEASSRGIVITKEELSYHPVRDMLVGIMILNWANTEEFATCLAFRHSNDTMHAVKLYAGVRVFACDNTSVSGNEIILSKRHTKHLQIHQHMPDAFDRYQNGVLMLTRSIEELKQDHVSVVRGREIIYDIFRKRIVPLKGYFHGVTDLWEAPETQEHMWSLHNCFTQPLQAMRPDGFLKTQTRLGKYFKLGKGKLSSQMPPGEEIIPNESEDSLEAIEAEFEALEA